MRMPYGGTRSIGEVLAILKQEFPDVTISKIRFLEGQGLINPQRTESGYRKFSDDDLDRLRYILRQQKEHFLPLKVIKGRLSETAADADDAPTGESSGDFAARNNGTSHNDARGNGVGAPMSRADFLSQSGLSESQLREMEGFGLVQGQRSGTNVWYDDNALVVARLAARFLQFGLDARHLRIFKTAAAREAELYKQLVPPVRSARNTQARMEAEARLSELTKLGGSLRDELLQQALEGS